MEDVMLKNKIRITLAVLFLLLIPVTGALAYFATINTNDNAVDSGWSASPLIRNSNSDGAAGYEIVNYWLVTDSNPPGNVYFRADLAGILDPDGVLAAELDCDSDNLIDYQILYYPPGSAFDDTVIIQDVNAINYDIYSSTTLGEQISSVYEWQVPVAGSFVNLTSCLANTFSTQLAAYYDDGSSSFLEEDITSEIELNTTTAVTLSSFETSQPAGSSLALAAAAGLILGAAGWAAVHLASKKKARA